MSIILLGFMGAGKTTIGRLIDPNFHDMDELIVEKVGMPITDFFATQGEPAFRQLETAFLEALIAADTPVISPGGGIVVNPHNRKLLEKNDRNIFLRVDFETLYDRIGKDTGLQRPLYLNNTKEEFKAIFDGRQHLYEEVATEIIDVSDKTPEEIVALILGEN